MVPSRAPPPAASKQFEDFVLTAAALHPAKALGCSRCPRWIVEAGCVPHNHPLLQPLTDCLSQVISSTVDDQGEPMIRLAPDGESFVGIYPPDAGCQKPHSHGSGGKTKEQGCNGGARRSAAIGWQPLQMVFRRSAARVSPLGLCQGSDFEYSVDMPDGSCHIMTATGAGQYAVDDGTADQHRRPLARRIKTHGVPRSKDWVVSLVAAVEVRAGSELEGLHVLSHAVSGTNAPARCGTAAAGAADSCLPVRLISHNAYHNCSEPPAAVAHALGTHLALMGWKQKLKPAGVRRLLDKFSPAQPFFLHPRILQLAFIQWLLHSGADEAQALWQQAGLANGNDAFTALAARLEGQHVLMALAAAGEATNQLRLNKSERDAALQRFPGEGQLASASNMSAQLAVTAAIFEMAAGQIRQ